jgi:hypothetical protein
MAIIVAGSASAQTSFILSNDANFSANQRFYKVNETLYMRVVAKDLDVTAIVASEFSLTPRGEGKAISGTFDNHLDGTFTAALPLQKLDGRTQSWLWTCVLADDDGHQFRVDADILVQGLIDLPEIFEWRGEIQSASASAIVIAGNTVEVDAATQVYSAAGLRLKLSDLQTTQKVSVIVRRELTGKLRAIQIFSEGDEAGELDITGTIEQRTETSVLVNGVTLSTDANTRITARDRSALSLADLRAGMQIKIRARQLANKVRLVVEINVRDDDDEDAKLKLNGLVKEIGAAYLIIAGARLDVDAGTSFEGFAGLADLAAGLKVKVEFEVRANGTLRARKIKLEDGSGEVEIHGTITALTENSCQIGGTVFLFNQTTVVVDDEEQALLRNALYSGLIVKIKGVRQANGSLVTVRVKVEDDLRTEIELKGFAHARTENSLEVGGMRILVTPNTAIEGELGTKLTFDDVKVGMFLTIKLRARLDPAKVALRIKIEPRFEPDELEITEIIESLAANALTVGKVVFKVDAKTGIRDRNGLLIDLASLKLGMVVKVKGRKQANSDFLAREISVKERIHAEAEIKGALAVIQGGILEVGGLTFRAGLQTILSDITAVIELKVGQSIEVRYRLLADGSRLALRIKVKNIPDLETELDGAIEAITQTGLIVSGASVLVSAATVIRGENGAAINLQDLRVAQAVEVQAIVGIGGLLVAREIKVKRTAVIAAIIEASSNGVMSLAGQQVAVDAQTLIVGRNNVALKADDLRAGTFVEIIAMTAASGKLGKSAGDSVVAQRIEIKEEGTITVVNSTDAGGALPTAFTVQQNFPNPFLSEAKSPALDGGNPGTTIRFMLKTQSQVTLKIYNLLGNEIRTLLSAPLTPGSYQARWDGRDNLGRPVASGIYIYRMTAGGQVQSRRMMITK